jgi:hypothetical protein
LSRSRSLIEEGLPESPPESPDEETRTIWIRCHPAIFTAVLSTLKSAVSLSLDALKKSPGHSENSYSVEVIDLRESINVFEITGPKSSQVVRGALTPTIANHTGEFKKVRHIECFCNLRTSTFILVLVIVIQPPKHWFCPKQHGHWVYCFGPSIEVRHPALLVTPIDKVTLKQLSSKKCEGTFGKGRASNHL